jgi:hypothetical protein
MNIIHFIQMLLASGPGQHHTAAEPVYHIDLPRVTAMQRPRPRLFCTARALTCLIVLALLPLGARAHVPQIFTSDPQDLARAKEKFRAGDDQTREVVDGIRKDADAALTVKNFSVVDKDFIPPSGDKHDYMSLSPYWWPDPSKPNGKPYIRKDGEFNPERDKYDLPRMEGLADAVAPLSLAWYFTGEEKYAAKAAELIRVWFFDPKTRMNPNMKYAQFRPGYDDLRPAGIIESNRLRAVVDADGLLKGSKSWTAEDSSRLKAWFSELLDYIQTSEQGKNEEAAPNNHGTWHSVQAATWALYVGDTERAKKIILRGRDRIAQQIEPDGRQPHELERTNAFDYSRFNILAHQDLAMLGQRVGLDLWNYKTQDGRSLRKALDWLLPYATGEKKWEYQQIRGKKMKEAATVLRRAANAYNDPKYEQAIGKIEGGTTAMTDMLFPPKISVK